MMPFYAYEADDQFGRSAAGVLEAASPAALRDDLATRGYHLKAITPQQAPPGAITGAAPTVRSAVNGGSMGANPAIAPVSSGSATVASRPAVGGRRLSVRAQAILFREFAASFRAGMNPYQACDMIGGRYSSGPLFQLLQWVKSQAQSGGGFADALATAPVTLDPSAIGIVRAGERGGFLPYVLDELGASYERQMFLESKLAANKIVYVWMLGPAILLMWPIGDIVKGSAAASNTGNPNVATSLQAGFKAYSYGVLHQSLPAAVIFLLLSLAWRLYVNTPAGSRMADRLALRVPVWGKMQRSLSLSRFLRILAHLYRGGIPLRNSWELAVGSVPNRSIASQLEAQLPVVAANQPLSSAFLASGLFGDSEVSMVATGERAGEVDAMLFRLASYEDETIDRGARTFPMMMHLLFLLGMAPLVIIVIYHFFVTYYNTISAWAGG